MNLQTHFILHGVTCQFRVKSAAQPNSLEEMLQKIMRGGQVPLLTCDDNCGNRRQRFNLERHLCDLFTMEELCSFCYKMVRRLKSSISKKYWGANDQKHIIGFFCPDYPLTYCPHPSIMFGSIMVSTIWNEYSRGTHKGNFCPKTY